MRHYFTSRRDKPSPYLSMLIIVLSASFILIFINYYTIKILSASRAYINGESHYSKAQKDATRHLVAFLYNKDFNEYQLFQNEIAIPLGDQIARKTLEINGDVSQIKEGFLQGRNHPDDLNDLIWLYKNFKKFPYFSEAIQEWSDADEIINELVSIGDTVTTKIKTNTLTAEDQQFFVEHLNTIIDELTLNQSNFSDLISEAARKIKHLLIIANIFFTLLILTLVSTYYFKTLKKLKNNKRDIEAANHKLQTLNKDIEKFVQATSLDLRSPISSLMGLAVLIRLEEDSLKVKDHAEKLYSLLEAQDQYIKEIIDYASNNSASIKIEVIDLNLLVNEIVLQFNMINDYKSIKIIKDLSHSIISTDVLRLRIILNHLISNAFKFSDTIKDDRWIAIRSFSKNNYIIIEIEDNGLGFNAKYTDQIFDMFFVTDSTNGSGLGLYIVKEAVSLLNGSITVTTQDSKGTMFTIAIPETKNPPFEYTKVNENSFEKT